MSRLAELVLVALLVVTAGGLLRYGGRGVRRETRVRERLAQLTAQGAGAPLAAGPDGADGAPDEPDARQMRLVRLLMGSPAEREEVEHLLAAAGSRRGPQVVLAFGLLRLAAPVAVGGGMLLLLPGGAVGLFMALSAASAAFLAPKQVLRIWAGGRAQRIRAELPFTLDLLVMMLESGVGIDQCFRTFAQADGQAAPLTRQATQLLVRDLERGAPHELALARWAERLASPGARDLAAVIVRAQRHGTPLARVLKEFSREFSELRIANARESVGRKSAQMTLVMLLLIMPALFIVLAGPAFATLGKAIRAAAGAN